MKQLMITHLCDIKGQGLEIFIMADQVCESVEKMSIKDEQLITPWEVQGAVVDGVAQAVNYDKLINQFGCSKLSKELIEKFERVTGRKAHRLIRRGMVFSHRDLETILNLHEAGKPFYLYTGRGPSSESMHLGHMIPFVFCQYLQEVFNAHIVIQMTDDEKFLWKDLTLEQCHQYAFDNAKDIIACKFDAEKTFIFSDVNYLGHMAETLFKVQKCVNFNQARAVFGFSESDSIGQIAYPATQIVPCFSVAFKHIFGGRTDIACLVPAAIDQDPYFRLARDVAAKLKYPKPASIYCRFLPALQGEGTKMSASVVNTAIYMTDTAKEIKSKINKYAFSGGKDTLELHREKGGNPDIDIAYLYLTYFLEDDEELARIYEDYKRGRMLSGEMKARCIEEVTKFVLEFQERRKLVTPEILEKFMPTPPPREYLPVKK